MTAASNPRDMSTNNRPQIPVKDASRKKSLGLRRSLGHAMGHRRTQKAASSSLERGAVDVRREHDRVLTACNRCRLKKTKVGTNPVNFCIEAG